MAPIRHVVVIYLENHSFDNYTQAPRKPVRPVHRPLPASAQRIRLTPALENDLT